MTYRDKVIETKDSLRRARKEKNEKISYQLLKELSKKRFLTVAVGAIDKLEQSFSVYWGGDELEEDQMSPEQLKFYNAFLDVRNKIFDQCNYQIKKFEEDLAEYNISRDPVQERIIIKTNKE